MIGIPNYRMFSGFFLVILPLLWLGACAFTWIFLSIPPQPEVMGESMRAVFSLFAPFLSVGILAVLLDIWFGKRIYEARNGWGMRKKGCSACAGMLLTMIRSFCRNAPCFMWTSIHR